ncbi:MAG: DUF1152 domain-containing protein [Desulfurococcales archaeon]|nr:DUF1152 domain-containing protein [Desulfurococcales archaeon]
MGSTLVDIARSGRRVLVFGAGGGGDILGASIVWNRLRRLGADALLGSVVWERFTVDPFPGPIPIEMLAGAEPLGWSIALVDGETVALRYGSTLKPQIVRVAGALGVKAIYLDLSKGERGLRQAFEDARRELGVEVLVGVDTGGDMLAKGCEDNLWSPLADAISLSAMVRSGLEAHVTILGPGADGELPTEQVLDYIASIARMNGLEEVFGLDRRDYESARKVEDAVVSEAGKLPLRAFEGKTGTTKIRGGTREVRLSPVLATSYLLDARKTWEWTPLPRLVEDTAGIGQASQALNEACVVTELDLEQELSRLREKGTARPVSLDEIRRGLRQRLMSRGCRPVHC